MYTLSKTITFPAKKIIASRLCIPFRENTSAFEIYPANSNILSAISEILISKVFCVKSTNFKAKTAFALNIAENVAMINHIPTAIFSLEMSKVQLAKRLVAMNSKVDSQRIRIGELEDDEWAKITESSIILGESTLYIDDTGSISINDLRSKCRKLKMEKGLGLIIIDYLQLMSGNSGSKNISRQQEISDISRSLKSLARELDCPVIALSQLSRKVEEREDKRPILSDLRESGAIEQDADVVMFLYRDEYYTKDASTKKGITEIIIGKQRNGPTCTVELKWLNQYTKFANLEYHDE